jgi:hypothetical protein
MAQHTAASHHAEASFHHGQAAQHHREAGHHYLLGKDYAHAAHQALLARGHTLIALRCGHEAGLVYAKYQAGSPTAPIGSAKYAGAGIEAMKADLSIAEHHELAAAQHEAAASHHREALKHEAASEAAAKEAEIAHRHAHQAVFHGDEAAMHHIEHYSKAGPSAELV